MKTLREHLFTEGSFDHVAADNMAGRVKDLAKNLGEMEIDSLKAIFRFVNLAINYLASECIEEDFTLQSLFKLLCTEVYDDGFKEGKITVFDVLLEEAIKKDRALFNMYHYYIAVNHSMPDNVYDIVRYSFEKYCEEENVIFDNKEIDEVRNKWLEEHTLEKKKEKGDGLEEQDIELAIKGLNLFNSFRWRFIERNLHEAFNTIERISNQRLREEIKTVFDDFNDHKNVYVAIEELIK